MHFLCSQFLILCFVDVLLLNAVSTEKDPDTVVLGPDFKIFLVQGHQAVPLSAEVLSALLEEKKKEGALLDLEGVIPITKEKLKETTEDEPAVVIHLPEHRGQRTLYWNETHDIVFVDASEMDKRKHLSIPGKFVQPEQLVQQPQALSFQRRKVFESPLTTWKKLIGAHFSQWKGNELEAPHQILPQPMDIRGERELDSEYLSSGDRRDDRQWTSSQALLQSIRNAFRGSDDTPDIRRHIDGPFMPSLRGCPVGSPECQLSPKLPFNFIRKPLEHEQSPSLQDAMSNVYKLLPLESSAGQQTDGPNEHLRTGDAVEGFKKEAKEDDRYKDHEPEESRPKQPSAINLTVQELVIILVVTVCVMILFSCGALSCFLLFKKYLMRVTGFSAPSKSGLQFNKPLSTVNAPSQTSGDAVKVTLKPRSIISDVSRPELDVEPHFVDRGGYSDFFRKGKEMRSPAYQHPRRRKRKKREQEEESTDTSSSSTTSSEDTSSTSSEDEEESGGFDASPPERVEEISPEELVHNMATSEAKSHGRSPYADWTDSRFSNYGNMSSLNNLQFPSATCAPRCVAPQAPLPSRESGGVHVPGVYPQQRIAYACTARRLGTAGSAHPMPRHHHHF